MEGIQGFTIGKGEAPGDQGQPAFYLIVSLFAESRDTMNAAFASPAGVAAGADVADFAGGGEDGG